MSLVSSVSVLFTFVDVSLFKRYFLTILNHFVISTVAMCSLTNGKHHKLSSEKDFEEIQIPVPWGHIAGKWWGPKNVEPPVLAIHGWQDNAGTFDTLAPLLSSQGISILCIDLPGHGLSSHYPEGQYYHIFWDNIHVLRRIIQYFKWKNVTLLGHSLGGGISFLYSAVYPTEVEKYISIDVAAPVARSPSKIINIMATNIDKFLKYESISKDQIPSYEYDDMIDIVEDGHKGSLTRKSCEILMRRGMKPCPNKKGKYYFTRDVRLKAIGLGFLTLEQILEFAEHIKCDVLNIRAESGLVLERSESYDDVINKIRQHAKSVDYHIVPGTHHVHLNNPERIVDFIVDFLNS